MLWRGAWNSCANYMIPDIFLGGLVNHVAGTLGLMLVQLFSYASGLGVGRDGVDPGASGVFPIRYFRHYLLHDDTAGFVQVRRAAQVAQLASFILFLTGVALSVKIQLTLTLVHTYPHYTLP
jgi:hypothetical protein